MSATEPESTCPRCGRVTLDHTLRELAACHPTADLNLDYNRADAVRFDMTALGQGVPAGAVVVRALVMKVPEAIGTDGTVPALGFTFYDPGGVDVAAQVLLVLDDAGMRRLKPLLTKSIEDALLGARRAR